MISFILKFLISTTGSILPALLPFVIIGVLLYMAYRAVKKAICAMPIVSDIVDGTGILSCSRAEGSVDVGESCYSHKECSNGTCGRATADDGAETICCKSGESGYFGAYDYCYGMRAGDTCWSDAMCASGTCDGNNGGFTKGKCKAKIPTCDVENDKQKFYDLDGKEIGEGVCVPCQSDDDCESDECARTSIDGKYRCVDKSCFCDIWDKGCQTAYWYWGGYGDGDLKGKHCLWWSPDIGGFFSELGELIWDAAVWIAEFLGLVEYYPIEQLGDFIENELSRKNIKEKYRNKLLRAREKFEEVNREIEKVANNPEVIKNSNLAMIPVVGRPKKIKDKVFHDVNKLYREYFKNGRKDMAIPVDFISCKLD